MHQSDATKLGRTNRECIEKSTDVAPAYREFKQTDEK